jgi:1,2-dihydroxy-3-keto-5-methylthiopentene dioxygenase
MSILSVFHPDSPALPNKVLTHHDDIAATLAEHVRFAHAEHGLRVRPGTAQDEVLGACRVYLDQLMTGHGSKAFVLLNRDGEDPVQVDVRDEHVHDADEVFAVVSGRAQVGLRLGGWVYSVLCEKGDQLVMPAGRGAGLSWATRRFAWRCACTAASRACRRGSPGMWLHGRFWGLTNCSGYRPLAGKPAKRPCQAVSNSTVGRQGKPLLALQHGNHRQLTGLLGQVTADGTDRPGQLFGTVQLPVGQHPAGNLAIGRAQGQQHTAIGAGLGIHLIGRKYRDELLLDEVHINSWLLWADMS